MQSDPRSSSTCQLILPPELWLLIIAHACPSVLPKSSSRQPFNQYAFDPVRYQEALDTKRALTLVSTMFRALATPYLYSELKLAVAIEHLSELLGDGGRGYGRYVRTLIVPYSSTQTPTDKSATPALSVLRMCPNVEMVVRPHPSLYANKLSFSFDVDKLPSETSNLKSLHWYHADDAATSGGINNLHHVLSRVPNLEFLSVRGALSHNYTLDGPAELPCLRTLHIRGVNPLFARQISLWPFRAVQHVVVDAAIAYHGLEIIWKAIGSQLKTVEFGRDLSFMLYDEVSGCLQDCPNLQHLMFYINFHLPPIKIWEHPTLSKISVHAHPNAILEDESVDAEWTHMDTCLSAFLTDFFPKLDTIQLYGGWEATLADSRFQSISQLAQSKKCKMVTLHAG